MVELEKIYQEVENLDPEAFMEVLKKIIGVNTSVPPANTYREYVDVISPYFKNLDYELEEVVVPEELVKQIPYPLEGPRINLIATKEFGQKNYVTFYGHMDTVPASNEGDQKWRYPPFEATMNRRGKIFGRGVGDMKGPMACLIIALQIIEKLNLTPKYNVRIVNCTDEETGIYPGIRYLTDKGYIKGTVVNMDFNIQPVIPVGFAGDLEVIVETIGKSCHSGMNYLGINALEEMIPILVELKALKEKVEKRESKDIPGFPRLGGEGTSNMAPMFNLDIIQSGDKINIVPNLCTLKIDRRIIPDENYEDVKKEIEEAVEKGKAKSKAVDVRTTFHYMYPPVRVNPNGPNILRFKKIISLVQNVEEDEINVLGMSFSTDMGFITQILDTDEIIFTGIQTLKSNTHGVNESVMYSDVKTFIKEIIVFLCSDL
ncbi:MAG: M20 family metallopeptidase [Candidatus Hermodarchaeota archaeon]